MVLLISLQIFKLINLEDKLVGHMGKKQWAADEIRLLEQIKTSNQQKSWKMISKLLSKKGYKRSEQECRHKWVNCLSPEINHGPWADDQLSTLYIQYERNLSRWSVIQKFLPNRTQIKIKNHFYGVLRNTIRFVLKYFERVPGKQTEISNKVNPNSLKSIYWGEGQFSYLQNEIQNLITNMKYRFNKQKLLKIVAEKEKLYEKLNDKILQEVKISTRPIQELEPRRKIKKLPSIPVQDSPPCQDEIADSQPNPSEISPPPTPTGQQMKQYLFFPPNYLHNLAMSTPPFYTFFCCPPSQDYNYSLNSINF